MGDVLISPCLGVLSQGRALPGAELELEVALLLEDTQQPLLTRRQRSQLTTQHSLPERV